MKQELTVNREEGTRGGGGVVVNTLYFYCTRGYMGVYKYTSVKTHLVVHLE